MNQKINKIKEIEKSIIDNSNPIFSVNNDLTIDQIELLILSSTSVARHSLFLWSSKKEDGLGYYDIVSPPNSAKGPPNWVFDNIWGTYTSALFTWNTWTALAGDAASSVVSAIREYWE